MIERGDDYMFGRKSKAQKEINVVNEAKVPLDMHSIVHVADSILEYQRQLAQREVESLDEMSEVQNAFKLATNENERLKDQVQEEIGEVTHSSEKKLSEVKDCFDNQEQQVVGVIKAIEEIASQTNLLSL